MRSALKKNSLPRKFSVRLRIFQDIADALTFLHCQDPIVIHRDIKGANVLLFEQHRAKLCDFGQSREHMEMTMTNQQGTAAWMAPEMILGRQYDEKVDVYSAGIVGWELFAASSWEYLTRTKACTQVASLVSVAVEGLRPVVPAACNPDVAEILGQCWLGPNKRPSAASLANSLGAVRNESAKERNVRLETTESIENVIRSCLSAESISDVAYNRIKKIKSVNRNHMLRRISSRAHINFRNLLREHETCEMSVDGWLQSIGLGQYASQFQEKQITSIAMISNLDENDLNFIGVTNVVHRKVMLTNKPGGASPSLVRNV